MDRPTEPATVALEQVTEAAFNGVLRALEARRLPLKEFPGPIIVGIIAWPEITHTEMFRQVTEPS